MVALVEKTPPGLPVWWRAQGRGDAGTQRPVMKVVEITFDSSYPTGGEAIDLSSIEMASAVAIYAATAQGYLFEADLTTPTAPKLKVMQGDNANVAAAPAVEVTNLANLATVVTRFLILGNATAQ